MSIPLCYNFLKRKVEMIFMFDLGMNLKNLRKSKKWTQKRLSKLLNVSEASISKYEWNIATPPLDTLRAYAALFNVSMDEILDTQSQGTLSLNGLTENQINIIRELTEILKQETSGNTIPENTYSIIGKIAVEICKTR